jgi:ClpP class serine protease
MSNRILAAIRSQPWAIVPEYLAAIEAIAARALDDPAVIAVSRDGHAERIAEAVAEMGTAFPGTRAAAIRDGVGSLPLFGPIVPRANVLTEASGATSLASLAADFRKLEASPEVRRILIVSDSPGGMITDVHQFGTLIARASKPVSVFVSGLCCSAAYWIASQASEIIADPSALIGSLGVMMAARVQEAPNSEGERIVHITSSNAPDKRADLTSDEGQAKIRAMLDEIEAVMFSDVARGRKVPIAQVREGFGRGATLSARQARQAGMIDRIEAGGLDTVLRQLAWAGRSATPKRAAAAHQLALIRAQFCI